MDAAVRQHFYAAVNSADIIDDPFPHLYAKNVFPADFYDRILANLPALDKYTQYSKKYSERYSLDLTPTTVKSLGPVADVWADLEGWLNSSEMLNTILKKFGPRMKMSYSYRERYIKEATTPEGVSIGAQSFLCRDFKNFALEPHTDAGAKLVVGIFYLSKDDKLVEFGTSIYRPKDPTLVDFHKSTRFEFDRFDLVKTFENRPNTFVAFLKTEKSFHGVEARPHPDVGRDVLFWIPRIGKIPVSARVGNAADAAAGAGTTLTVPASIFAPEEAAVA